MIILSMKFMRILLTQKTVSIISRPGEVFRLHNERCILKWCILSGGTDDFVVDKDADTARETEEQEENEDENSKAGSKEIQEEINHITFLIICHYALVLSL